MPYNKIRLKTLLTLFIFSFTSMIAQTPGPAGVLNNAAPGTVFWLRADQGIFTTGSEVTQWNDQMGNGNNATATNGPAFSAAGMNGQDALLFDGIDNNLTIGNNTRINDGASTNRTLFVTFETGASIPGSGNYQLIYEQGGGTNGLNIYLEDGDAVLYLWENQNGSLDANQEYFARVPISPNTPYIAAIKYVGDGTTQGRVDFYLNSVNALALGSPIAMPTANLADFASHTGDINLGGAPSAGDTQFIGDIASTGDFFNGLIAEMIYYDATLNQAEFQIVFNYLAEKYNVTLGSGDVYAEPNYNLEITGIGQRGGETHLVGLGNGGALYLEDNGGINANGEFLLAGHDGSSHGQTSNSISAAGLERYARSWYIQKSGIIDGAKLIFNTAEAGFGAADDNGRVAADYSILYRSSTLNSFVDLVLPATLADGAGTADGNKDVVFTLNNTQLQSGYYTLGFPANQTWYSYTTGNWNDPGSWTLDGSSTPLLINPGNETPDPNDDVVITNGRTITMDINNVTIQSIEVLGRLALSTTTGHDFNVIDGNGIIRMLGDGSGNDNFPDGIVTGANGFANSANGGTLEILGNGINLNQTREFNDVKIDLDNSSNNAILLADYQINGDLTIRRGTFQINNNAFTTSLTIDLFGDMAIASNGNLRVGTANARHEFNFYGDFLNQGNARFSQRTTQNVGSEANNGIVDANFIAGDRNQQMNANGPTYFYRIEVNKGVDDTYTLFLESNSTSNFRLTGPADYNLGGDVTTTNQNAMGLIIGTVSIGSNVVVNPLNSTGNYSIGSNAKLLVAGGQVTKRGGAAITPYGTIEVTSGILEVPSGSGITTRGAGQIIVSGGEVWVSQIRTSIFGASAVGGFRQTGGTVNVWDYSAAESPITGLAAGNASNSYSRFCLTYEDNTFIMSGGTLNVKNATNRGLLFIKSDPGNINVTGGTVNLYSNVNNESEVASLAPFWDLNIINESSGSTARITSETLTCGPGGSNSRTITNPDLKVLNDLTIQTGTLRNSGPSQFGSYLDLCSDGTNCVNLEIGGDLRIEDNGVLDLFNSVADNTGSATLTFNRSGNAQFYVGDITDLRASLTGYDDPDGDDSYQDYRLPIYNLRVDKNGDTLQLAAKNPTLVDNGQILVGGGKNLDANNARLLYISNGITIASKSTLSQIDPTGNGIYGYIVRVYSPTINIDGNLLVYEQGVNPTNSFLEVREVDPDGIPGTDVGDVILINSTEGSTIGNLVMDLGNDELEITSDLFVSRFVYRHGGLNIGTHNLKVDIFDFNTESNGDDERLRSGNGEFLLGENTSGARQYIYTAGNASDGGLSIKWPRITNEDGVDDTDNIGKDPSYDTENDEYQNNNLIWFPIGLADRYTPAIMWTVNAASTTPSGDEYITVRPVDGILQTTDLSGGDLLSYYWNIKHEGFDDTALPTVSWLFQYDQDDVSGTESNYVPGKVLDGGTYERSYDGTTEAVKDAGDSGNGSANDGTENNNILGSNPGNIIIFNGFNTGNVDPQVIVDEANDDIDNGTNNEVFFNNTIRGQWTPQFPNTGFTLENANYTAGVSNRFVGAPQIFYSRLPNNSSWYNRNWRVADHWSLVPHDGANNNSARPAAGTWPQEGDIAVIGFGGYTGGISPRHSIEIQNGDNISVAEIQFNHPGNNGNRLVVLRNATLSFGKIGGTGGTFMQRLNAGDAATISGDFGDFYSKNSFTYAYYLNNNGTYNITPPTDIFPNLRVEGGNNNRVAIFQSDITVNNNMIVDGNTVVQTSGGANGDITVLGDLRIGGYLGGNFRFGNSEDRTVEVGRLWLRNQGNCNVTVLNTIPDGRRHRLIINGDILQQRPGQIDLFNGLGALDNNAILELKGVGNHSYTKTNGSVAEFYQIIMNKGNDTTSSFIFSESFNIPDATTNFKPIEILNGKFILDNSNLNSGAGILIANGSDFLLPNTNNPDASSGSGAIEIRQGILRMEGDNTGLILDGLIRVSGTGVLDLEDGTNNVFVEYTSSGNAQFDITGGTLNVGGQIRRGLLTTTGILKFSQSAGSFMVGSQNPDEEPSRGVFEVLNAGSNFTHTGGSFTLAGSNGSATVPSLLLEPQSHNVNGSTITISYSDGDDNFGIKSTIELNNLELTGTSFPTVNLYQLDLTLRGNMNINADNTFDARGFNLRFTSGNLVNNGTFISSGNNTNQQTTLFTSAGSQEVSGSGTSNFYNFDKRGNGVLTASKDFTIENELFIRQGTFATGSQSINIKGDLTNLSNHISSVETAGTLYGLILSGNQKQILVGIGGNVNNISNFGVLAINNPEGAIIQDGTQNTFRINNKLILEQGVLDISSNLLIVGENAVIENENGDSDRDAFETSNMVQTNSSFTDFGLQKLFNTGAQTDFVFPIGQQIYTPVEVDMSANLLGTTPSITVRPANEPHPTIVGHDNSGANSPGTLDDNQNVLQYHWIITSRGITSLTGDILMEYDPSDVVFLDPGNATASPLSFDVRNYAAARLLANSTNWDKSFDGSSFDENRRLLIFDQTSAFNGVGDINITGDYTAGLLVEDDGVTPLDIGAIPNNVLEYETINAIGNYFTNTDWNGLNGSPPLGPGENPNGAIIYIRDGDVMNLNAPNARIYRTVIDEGGVFSLDENADNTRLGIVQGTGTLRIESNTVGQSPQLPAGYYEDFLTCSGGGLEYAGTVNYDVLANIPEVRRVIFSGSGLRELPNNNFLICEDFILRNSVSVTYNSDQQITVWRDIIKSDNATVDFGVGTVYLNGTASAQNIVGDFLGNEAFYNLTVDNANGLSIINNTADAVNEVSLDRRGDVGVSNRLLLINGLVNTDVDNSLVVLLNATVNDGNSNTYVNGPLQRQFGNNPGSSFNFPIGKSGRYGLMSVVNPITTPGTKNWEVEYFNQAPPNPYSISSGSIEKVSETEYWSVSDGLFSSGSTQAGVRLRWDVNSAITPSGNINDLVTAYYDGSGWVEVANSAPPSGNTSNGNVTSNLIPFSNRLITFGTQNQSITPLPVELVEFTAKKIENAVLLEWQTLTEVNNDRFEIQRTVDGVNFDKIGEVQGAGTTTQKNNYQFIDRSPKNGINYYRLRQVDFDGAFEYSPIRSVKFNQVGVSNSVNSTINIYPNPSGGAYVFIDIINWEPNEFVEISLYNPSGNVYYNQKITLNDFGSFSRGFDLPTKLAKGLYFLNFRSNKKNESYKLIVQ